MESSELFDGSSSGVSVVTAAELVKVLPPLTSEVTCAEIFNVGEVPGTSSARRQTTLLPTMGSHVQPFSVKVISLKPSGKVSVTITSSAVDGPWFVTTMENSVRDPARTGLAPVVDLAMLMSVESLTISSSVEVLFSLSGSCVVVDSTVAVLKTVSGPAEGSTAATTVMSEAVPPVANVAERVQVMSEPLCVHTQPLPLAETKVNPTGNESFTTMSAAASEGPALVTARVNEMFSPAMAFPVCDLTMARSASPVNSELSASSLLFGLGSGVVESTTAVLAILPTTLGEISTLMSTSAVAPLASDPVRSHVTVPADSLHVHDPLTELKLLYVPLAGKVSVIVTDCASDGPTFFATRRYVAVVPATTEPIEDLVKIKSADVSGVVVTSSVLLVESGSVVGPVTLAELTTSVARPESTRTTTLICPADESVARSAA